MTDTGAQWRRWTWRASPTTFTPSLTHFIHTHIIHIISVTSPTTFTPSLSHFIHYTHNICDADSKYGFTCHSSRNITHAANRRKTQHVPNADAVVVGDIASLDVVVATSLPVCSSPADVVVVWPRRLPIGGPITRDKD